MHAETYKNIDKMYDKLTYFDQYGGSLFLFFIVSILVLLGLSYCIVMINLQPIQDNWVNERCKPYIMPFAGIINKPQDTSAMDYTQQNFQYCMQNVVKDVTGTAVQPMTFVVNILNSMANIIKESINAVRNMFNKVRTQLQEVTQEIMGRLGNIMIPLQQIIISMRDILGKVQGIMTASLFTLLGSYYTLQSLMGAIAQFIVTILIALAATIAVMWLAPFTWATAASMTVIFISIAIPMTMILDFMMQYLHVGSSLQIPTIQCFDEDTLLEMEDGTKKKIVDIQIGEKLVGGNRVNTKFKVDASRSVMYDLDGILVSDSHLVQLQDGSWVRVSQHPLARKLAFYWKPYLYCFNTDSKMIQVGSFCFSDWDEVVEPANLNTFLKKINSYYQIKKEIFKEEVHHYLNCGFKETTLIPLENGGSKEIQSIEIGDVLENGEKVVGVVEMDETHLNTQLLFHLGIQGKIEGSCNLFILDKRKRKTNLWNLDKKITITKGNNMKLFHLLTDTQTFFINTIQFLDYNASIDQILENPKQKKLSMNYV